MAPGMQLLALAALPAGVRAAYPGSDSCTKPGSGFKTAPRFHLMDQTGCGENDPNGPVFDPVHGVIHHFYQDHIAAPGGRGPIYGHFVSKDFVHWAQMPVAIWNGLDASVWPPKRTPYDTVAIYTGSGVVVDGAGPDGKGPGVVQIYPGLCKGADWHDCTTGTLLAQAIPADYAGDELLTNWTKPAYNPIMSGTQRDPSTPWKTASGEWRLRTFNSQVYGSASDADLLAGKWYHIGTNKNFTTDECPSFYPLPESTPGFEAQYAAAKAAGEMPTHVHKVSSSGQDSYQLGTYVDGAPKTTGTWTKTPGWEDAFKFVRMDHGGFYASKDNEYPTKDGGKRRINWGWAWIPGGSQTLPREITFNAAIRRLQSFPIEELETLRGPAAYDMKDISLQANGSKVLDLAPGVTRHSDVVVDFAVPSQSTTFGINVGGVHCSVHFPSSVNMSAPFYEVPVSCGKPTDVVRLLPSEKTIQIRILADASLVEVYFQAGRVAMTVATKLDDASQVTLTANEAVAVPSAVVYPMKDMWVTPEEVRKSPRVYKEAVVQYV